MTTIAPPPARLTPAARRSPPPQRGSWTPVTASSRPSSSICRTTWPPPRSPRPGPKPWPRPPPNPGTGRPSRPPSPALVLPPTVRREHAHAQEWVAARDRVDRGGRQPPLAVERGERPRLGEQPLPELCRRERGGGAVGPRGGRHRLAKRERLCPQDAEELAARRAVVDPDERDEAQREENAREDDGGASHAPDDATVRAAAARTPGPAAAYGRGSARGRARGLARAREQQHDARGEERERGVLGDRQAAGDAHVDAHELEQEAERTGEQAVARHERAVGQPLPSPSHEQPRERAEERGLVQLRGMDRHRGRRQAARERHAPWQRGRPAVVVADEEAADAAERLADGHGRRGGGEQRDDRPAPDEDDRQPDADAADESAEPAQAAAVREEVEDRLLAEVLDRPEDLRADEARDRGDRGEARPARGRGPRARG